MILRRFGLVRGTRHVIGLIAGALCAAWLLLAAPGGLSRTAAQMAAVMLLVVIWWATEALPIALTAVIGVAAAMFLGVAAPGQVIGALLDPVILLFVGTFLLARALETHGVDQRIARAMLTHPWVCGSARRTLLAFGLTAWCLAMWMSITACVAMLLPVALALSRGAAGARAQTSRFGTGMLLLLVYAASAGAMATPVGTPPNLIGVAFIRDLLGRPIGFLEWMAVGLPIALLLFFIRYGMIIWLFPPEPGAVHALASAAPPWTRGARNSLLAFAIVVALWIGPGVVALLLGSRHPAAIALKEHVVPGYAALLGAGLLLVWPTEHGRRPALSWRDALRIDWGTILLFGCGLALGRLMMETGLSGLIGRAVLGAASARGTLVLIAAAVVLVTLLSNVASNTASAAMALPVILSLLPAGSLHALPLAMAGTFAASLGFLLPVSTPGNAMVYGTGLVRSSTMIRTGVIADLAGMLVVWAASIWLVPLVLK